MDVRDKAPVLVILIICIHQVSGVKIPQPDKLDVNILDGEVIAHWKPPEDAPPNSKYNVQMAKYIDEWATLEECTEITNTYCDLSSSIHDHHTSYKVRVQLVTGNNVSSWTRKKFTANDGKLQPPSFTLWATSTTLMVYVHQKPIFKKLFPFGIKYTIYLEETGINKNITDYLTDDTDDDRRIKLFTSLHWGKQYCVSIMAEGNGGRFKSSVSTKQCLYLPEQEWFIIAVSSLSVLGVMSTVVIILAILLCYVKSPRKTPAGLKSPVSGWLPLSVDDGPIEVVTDKGWFLSSYRTEEKHCDKVPVASTAAMETSEEEERRTSLDSGVSIESNSVSEVSPPMRQNDSGCGSMGSSESSGISRTGYPLENEGEDIHIVGKMEDRGVGMSSKLESSSMNLNGQEHVEDCGVNYHRQSPSALQISVCDDEKMFTQILPDSNLAEVVTGYRAGPQACICSGAGQCTWCHKQGHCRVELNKICGPMRIENALLASQCGLADSYKADVTFTGRASQIDSVLMDELQVSFLHLGNALPLTTAMSALPLTTCGQDFNTSMSLSLCDVQLQAD